METIILIGVVLMAFIIGFLIGCMVTTPKLEPAKRYDPTELSDEDEAWARSDD